MAKRVQEKKPTSSDANRREGSEASQASDPTGGGAAKLAKKGKQIKDEADKVAQLCDEAIDEYRKSGFESAAQYVQRGGE